MKETDQVMLLPVTVDFDDVNFNDAKGDIGQDYIYGPVSVTNHSNKDFNNLNLRLSAINNSVNVDSAEYIEVVDLPEGFSLRAGETRNVTVVYHPLKITTDFVGAFWAEFYVEDDSGSKSATNEGHYILVFPESERDVEQQFVKKWKRTPDGDEFIYAYDITLKNNEDILVTDWFLFFNIKGGGYFDPDWLISEKSWVRAVDYKTSVSNSLLMSAENTSHVIKPNQDVNLRIQIIYKGENTDYETVDNLGFNYKVTLKNAEHNNRFRRQ